MQTRLTTAGRNNFNILYDINIEPAIIIRKNASTKSNGCPLKRDEVFLIKDLGLKGGSS